jgi:hypothetical protein
VVEKKSMKTKNKGRKDGIDRIEGKWKEMVKDKGGEMTLITVIDKGLTQTLRTGESTRKNYDGKLFYGQIKLSEWASSGQIDFSKWAIGSIGQICDWKKVRKSIRTARNLSEGKLPGRKCLHLYDERTCYVWIWKKIYGTRKITLQGNVEKYLQNEHEEENLRRKTYRKVKEIRKNFDKENEEEKSEESSSGISKDIGRVRTEKEKIEKENSSLGIT